MIRSELKSWNQYTVPAGGGSKRFLSYRKICLLPNLRGSCLVTVSAAAANGVVMIIIWGCGRKTRDVGAGRGSGSCFFTKPRSALSRSGAETQSGYFQRPVRYPGPLQVAAPARKRQHACPAGPPSPSCVEILVTSSIADHTPSVHLHYTLHSRCHMRTLKNWHL